MNHRDTEHEDGIANDLCLVTATLLITCSCISLCPRVFVVNKPSRFQTMPTQIKLPNLGENIESGDVLPSL